MRIMYVNNVININTDIDKLLLKDIITKVLLNVQNINYLIIILSLL